MNTNMNNPVPTGFHYLDTVLNAGFAPGVVTVFKGDPRTGKTTMMINNVINAITDDISPLMVSLEEDEKKQEARLVTSLINHRNVKEVIAKELADYPLYRKEFHEFDWEALEDKNMSRVFSLANVLQFIENPHYQAMDQEERLLVSMARQWVSMSAGYRGCSSPGKHHRIDDVTEIIDTALEREQQRHDHEVAIWDQGLERYLGREEELIDYRYHQYQKNNPRPQKSPMILFVDSAHMVYGDSETYLRDTLNVLKEIAVTENIPVVTSIDDRDKNTRWLTDETVIDFRVRENRDFFYPVTLVVSYDKAVRGQVDLTWEPRPQSFTPDQG